MLSYHAASAGWFSTLKRRENLMLKVYTTNMVQGEKITES